MTVTAIATTADLGLARYTDLEQRIQRDELDGVLARWEFGRLLLTEREANGGKQLPAGRLAEVCAAVGRSRRDIQYRMQLAERYPTEDEVRTACALLGGWADIRDELITRPKPTRRNYAAEWLRLVGDIHPSRDTTASYHAAVQADSAWRKARAEARRHDGLELLRESVTHLAQLGDPVVVRQTVRALTQLLDQLNELDPRPQLVETPDSEDAP